MSKIIKTVYNWRNFNRLLFNRLFYSFESMKKVQNLEGYQLDQMKEIASSLKRLRIERGYSNYDNLAYDMGMSRSQYGAYENGQNLTLTTLMKILNHFNMTIFDFFEYIKLNSEKKNVSQ